MRYLLRPRTLCVLLLATALAAPSARAQAVQPTPAGEGSPETRQPRWTAQPLFSESDVYVLPKGVAVFVVDLRSTAPADGATVTDTAYRAEFGLPARFQLGLHASGRTQGDGAIGNIDAQALELRWAPAGWGRVWGNPTVQMGWTEASRGPDVGALKLLLGGGMASAWRWGTNVAWTQEVSGGRATDRSWTAGVSRAAGRFTSVGAETRLAFVDSLTADGRSRTPVTREFLAGPSLQIRPLRQLYIDAAALFGATTGPSRSRTALVAGWQF